MPRGGEIVARLRIKVKIKDILKEKKKTKYWLIKNMEGGYQSISNLMNNQSSAIRFETLEKLCKILECTPGDILELTERRIR